jgi:hypothetical protein
MQIDLLMFLLSGSLKLCNSSSKLRNFLSLLCSFFAKILASDKRLMGGPMMSDPKRTTSPAARTDDLRRMKTEDLGLFDAFSVGETTTRNANAPS